MPRQSHRIKRPENGFYRILGLMSGTSMDGIDVALLETDGRGYVRPLGFATIPYTAAFRGRLRDALGRKQAPTLERELTKRHAQAVQAFLKKHRMKAGQVHALGFHGHTLLHDPCKKITVQIGDGKLLAKLTGIPVVWDFRTEDVKAGGQGAPLVPVYHQALAAKWKKPVAFLNIGGVANLTYIGAKGELIAFDTGPGNALLDDWMMQVAGKAFDKNGQLAAKGRADKKWLAAFSRHAFFKKKPPKSLDRNEFNRFLPRHLSAANGAATLAAMTVHSIAMGLKHLPQRPAFIAVAGGGRKNAELLRLLKKQTGCDVAVVEKKKLNGDALEAEAFAYLAARVLEKLPISFKGTTGRRAN